MAGDTIKPIRMTLAVEVPTKEHLGVLLQRLRDFEQTNSSQIHLDIGTDLGDMGVEEVKELLSSIKPSIPYMRVLHGGDESGAKAVEKAREWALQHEGEGLAYQLAAYAEHVLAQRWVSVEERLPEIDKELLLMTRDGRRTGWLRLGQQGWNIRGGNVYAHDYVTHWQPLPEPPEAKK